MSVLRFLCFHCLYKTKMNMMLQHTPESQKYGLRQGSLRQTEGPCQTVMITTKPNTVKALRQNVTSKP